MRTRWMAAAVAAMCAVPVCGSAQAPDASLSGRYVDPVAGLTLDNAVAQALAREPSLRAARAGIDEARGAEVEARLRANPSASVERREEPGGTDTQTMVSVQWPLELFRRRARIALAEREREVVELEVTDRERLLAAEVRARYGDLLAAVRDLTVLDELVASVSRQHHLLAARVTEGASPALDRDLVEVELRRWQADRLLQLGRTDAALHALKRAIGLPHDAPLRVREDLEGIVSRQGSAPEVEGAIDKRPDVRSASVRIDVAGARADRARREGRPDVSLFASYARMDAGFMQRGFAPDGTLERIRNRMNYLTGGIMIMVPLFDRNQGEIAAAEAGRAGAVASLEAARLDAAAGIAAARAEDQRAQEAAGLFTSGARTLAQKNLDVVGRTYELGRATVFDVLAEQRRYLDFERAFTEALRRAYEARTALLTASGGVR